MTFVVQVPPDLLPERRYICRTLLSDRLGLKIEFEPKEVGEVVIRLAGDPMRRELRIPDLFLGPAGPRWLSSESIPQGPCSALEVPPALLGASPSARLPAPWMRGGQDGLVARVSDKQVLFDVDVMGLAFFCLTRYEEVAAPQRDRHGRFPAAASLASRQGWLDRPLVDEYLMVLASAMNHLWRGATPSPGRGRWVLTHDVDHPFCVAGRSAGKVAVDVIGDCIRRRDPGLALRRIRAMARSASEREAADVCNTFRWIMELSEQAGTRSAFYFFGGRTEHDLDGAYSLNDPRIRALLREIASRGHEIGLHPSYRTLERPDRLQAEFAALRECIGELGIEQARWGGRQHYLRWSARSSWKAWDEAGLDYDSSVGFADRVGFRCGTSRPFTTFDCLSRTPLRLQERPLIFMEVSALGPQYMRLTHDAAVAEARRLADLCMRFGGEFVLLWHNSNLLTSRDRSAYGELLRGLVA
jgi:hypothetical protein